MNNFVIFVAIIWSAASVASIFTKDEDPISAAAVVTLFAGLAYFLLKIKG